MPAASPYRLGVANHPPIFYLMRIIFHQGRMPVKSPLVVFDLDGTLIDTAPDLIASLNHTIAALDLAPVGYGDLTHLVGQGARAMIERACALRGHQVSDDALPPLMERFIAFYTDTMPGDSKPYPGLLASMDALKAAGFGLAVCTNKMESLALTLLNRLDLTERFNAITGGDSFPVRKPHAEHLIGTVSRAGGELTRTVMVGDSVNDVLVARNAGVPSIAVPFGYSDVGIETLNPSHIIAHFDELTPALVESLLVG